ncbi:MAG TPA: phosphatase PAP2 family protein [Acidobacteriota bacterium]|nr:phosphatase PAP2 family protein [Acidobacteriota bacterium]
MATVQSQSLHLQHTLGRFLSIPGDLLPIIAVIVLIFIVNNDLGAKLFVSITMALAIVIIIRFVYPKQRPIPQIANNFLQRIDAASFPSMHMTRISTVCTILAIAYPPTIAMSVILIACTWLGRVLTKKHYSLDCAAGVILGILCGAVWLL